MSRDDRNNPARRRLLAAGLALPALMMPGVRETFAQAGNLPATPACGDAPTPKNMEGPFYKPRSPQRTSLLEPGIEGAKLMVTGYVLTKTCNPVQNAVLDFWHCDADGEYDNTGFRLRGHQFTDAAGRYRLETIVPGVYPGRTRHVHVKVQAADGPLLTTQLYFPGEPGNRSDFIFLPALLMNMSQANGTRLGRFDFVLDAG
ncbi:MAG TPA: intradiol ring-cleavage dioxygenase [Burkholderiales bacterium]|nr:intradiol ring-cleavage dioxygenase [Burkholderiales bacterium]